MEGGMWTLQKINFASYFETKMNPRVHCPSHTPHTLLCNIERYWEHTVHTRNYKSIQESDYKILRDGA